MTYWMMLMLNITSVKPQPVIEKPVITEPDSQATDEELNRRIDALRFISSQA